ncbi:MAG: ABC-F family ATP-binding cassette domain-containing protein [Clostridia bacterium]|nr:ABC-F family ATP-binding cassette domain-containing protein [Clostridia bacterium]
MTAIQIRHLTVNHTKDLRCLIRDLSFTLREQDRAAIIGEEGNGKSTLLKLIDDPSLVENYCEYSGEILRPSRIGYLEQELPGHKAKMTLYEIFCAVPGFYDRTPAELSREAKKLGLPPDIYYSDRTLGTFSGGENVKLRLLSLIVGQPELLLLDEPSNDLDIPTLEWLEKFIRNSEVPVLYISHDETLLENTANVIIHMEQVRRKTIPVCTVSRCGYREYVDRREASRAHQTQVARKEREEYEKQQEKFRRIQSRVEHEQNAVSRQDPHGGRLLKKKMAAVKSLERRFEREHNEMTQLPETEDEIFVRFSPEISSSRGKTILDLHLDTLSNAGGELARDIHLHVGGGEKLCIVGRNGAGKTTLLRLVAEQLLARRDIRAAYMPQNYAESMDMSLTPVEFLSRSGDKEELTAIRTYLGSMRYTAAETEHPISGLSGGQKAKLYFIKMNLDRCDVLLLDEPTRNFSPLSGPIIRQALKAYGGTIISVSHDRKFISEVCDRVFSIG